MMFVLDVGVLAQTREKREVHVKVAGHIHEIRCPARNEDCGSNNGGRVLVRELPLSPSPAPWKIRSMLNRKRCRDLAHEIWWQEY